MFTIGYYARNGHRRGMVHFFVNGKAVCGRKFKTVFQWCSSHVQYSLIECKYCRTWIDNNRERL